MTTIALGNERQTIATCIDSLGDAQGKRAALDTHLLLAHKVGLLAIETCDPLTSRAREVGKLLCSFIRALKQKETRT